MGCQYSRPGPVSSEKHQGTLALRWRARWSSLDGSDRHGGDARLLDSACAAGGQQLTSKVSEIIAI
jgi:hypothetical protein